MTTREHCYLTALEWTGNTGTGTASYTGYKRAHEIRMEGKPPIPGSSDPSFRGDPGRHNPEELLVASLSACHMLWYLHLCADRGIVVSAYVDHAEGVLVENADCSGQFTRVVLRPEVTVSRGDLDMAKELHHEVPAKCFIARSMNFSVLHEPVIRAAAQAARSA